MEQKVIYWIENRCSLADFIIMLMKDSIINSVVPLSYDSIASSPVPMHITQALIICTVKSS